MPTVDVVQSRLVFAFPEVHPNAKLTVTLHRTLRIPDDGKEYPLPPSLGAFPIRKVDGYLDRVPAKWVPQGGVMVPMYASEALWVSFETEGDPSRGNAKYPFAIRMAAGMRSAVTGEAFSTEGAVGTVGDKQDYMVTPPQPWLDGFIVEEGLVKQFVAAPLGEGVTVEAQLSGEEKFGGIQLQVFPMKKEVFEAENPIVPQRTFRGGIRGMSASMSSMGGNFESMNASLGEESFGASGEEEGVMALNCVSSADSDEISEGQLLGGGAMRSASVKRRAVTPKAEMGLGVGGRMRQQVMADPHGVESWETEGARLFVHLTNSLAWLAVTRENPPPSPATESMYRRNGYTWYEHYTKDADVLGGTAMTKGLQSLLELGFQKMLAGGEGILPDNGVAPLPGQQPVQIKDKPPVTAPVGQGGNVRDGNWGG